MKIKKRISCDMFGQAWPFNISSGILVIDEQKAVYFKHMLKKYGLNGPARMNGGANPEPIWNDSPILTHKMSLLPILNYAIDLYTKHLRKKHE